jgi:hypothetical protein
MIAGMLFPLFPKIEDDFYSWHNVKRANPFIKEKIWRTEKGGEGEVMKRSIV